MDRRLRRGEGYAILAVLVVMALILFWPTHVDAPIDGTLFQVLAWLHAHGVPGWFDYDFVEFAANILLFVPLGALVASLTMHPLWWTSGVAGLTFSLIVEFTQEVFLPGRTGSADDLIANTTGALLGGSMIALLRSRKPQKGQPRM
jgi:glycopeptide antibiotics resistance protein